MKNQIHKQLSRKRIPALALALIMCLSLVPATVLASTTSDVIRDITAAELVAEMGMLNTNHARALDRIDYDNGIGYAADPNPNDQYSKVQWITLWTDSVTASVPAEFSGLNRFSDKRGQLNGFGEFYTLEKFTQIIKEFKNVGYKAVRLPVSWTYWTNSTTHEIDKEWMDLVETCVKIILDNGLYCMINAHEDYMGRSWVGDHWADDWMLAQYKDYVNTRYVAIWKQVSERFRDYGDHLLFESFNEPSDRKRDYLPYDQIVKNGIARVNEMQALFVKTVRESGGNNAKRFLSLTHFMSIADHIGLNMLDTIDLPKDKNIIIQTHYYFHSDDGSAVRSWNINNAYDRASIDKNFTLIKQFMGKTGVPVILGEFANTEWLSTRDRIDQATYILEKAKELGVPVFWWEATMDTDWDKTGYDGAFSLYNRNKMAWEHPDILNAMMAVVKNPWDGASDWAADGVKSAISLGLATQALNQNYQSNTTRLEFCAAAVNFLEKYYNKTIDAILSERGLTRLMFSDTSDLNIGAAAALGITSGTDPAANTFTPDRALNREEAATMLQRVMNVVGADTPPPMGVLWTDANDISSWAQSAADVMYSAKIMGGTSTTELVFSPKAPYTHEQSIMTLNNLWRYLETVKAALPTTAPSGSVKEPEAQSEIAAFKGTAKEVAPSAEAKEIISNADKAITYKRLSVNGIEIISAYRDDGKKKPLIFIMHGGGGRKELMFGDIDRYAHEGFYAVALDVAGCGDSNVGPIMAYKAFETTVGYIDTLIEYANTLPNADAGNFAVGGGSMGGSISFCYAAYGKYKPKVILPDAGTPDLLLNSAGPMFDCFDHGKAGQPMTMTEAEVKAFAKEYSPINRLERFEGIAIYAKNGAVDEITPPTGCKNLESELKKLGYKNITFVYYEELGHEAFPDDGGAQMRFLKQHIGL
ncbi:MAG: glycoside hydrolase family 5 protein [Oscillospiraceae bacterium]|jgi:pimeloyl-ACP methyl ester carboxylesterase|nr:glycoside hydrolase family 5 protein [Oscillospiraceae bacterium]